MLIINAMSAVRIVFLRLNFRFQNYEMIVYSNKLPMFIIQKYSTEQD